MRRRTLNRLICALMALTAVSCSIKEDRSDYPCWLSIFFDLGDLASHAGPDELALYVSESGSELTLETVDLKEYNAENPYEITVKKGEVTLAAVRGMDKSSRDGRLLRTSVGNEFDKLWISSTSGTYTGELASETITPHKQYCQLSVTVNGKTKTDVHSIIIGKVNGIDMLTLAPNKGDYIYQIPYDGDVCTVAIPRQGDEELSIIFPSTVTADRVFDLKKIFEDAKYDWNKEDLDNMALQFNIDQATGSITTVDFLIYPGWEGITLKELTYILKHGLNIDDWTKISETEIKYLTYLFKSGMKFSDWDKMSETEIKYLTYLMNSSISFEDWKLLREIEITEPNGFLAGSLKFRDWYLTKELTIKDSTYVIDGMFKFRDWYLSDEWDGIVISDSTYWTQKEVLMRLFEATNGKKWKNNDNWGSDKPISEWYGINADWQGNIYSINLQNNNLVGDFICDLSPLTELTSIDLSENILQHIQIESERLDYLRLYNCKASELDVKGCPSLRYLECQSNALKELDLSNKLYLETLYASNNILKSIDLSGCSNLEYLGISNNQLTELNLRNLGKLYSLECSYNQITALNLSECSNLQYVYCYGCSMGYINLSNLGKLSNLYIESNNLSTIDLSGCPNLRDFNCSYNPLTSLDLTPCKRLNNIYCYSCKLQSLDFTSNEIIQYINCNDNLLSSINVTGCSNLNSLNCNSNILTNIDLSTNLKLEYLYCDNNHLNVLDLSANSKLKRLECRSNGMSELDVAQCRSLQEISCGGDNVLNELVLSSEYLLNLECRDNPYLHKVDIQGCPNLNRLNIGYNSNLTEIVFGDRGGMYLDHIQIDGCSSLTEIDFGASAGRNVTYLNANYCKKLTALDLRNFSKMTALYLYDCQKLQTLNLRTAEKLEELYISSSNELNTLDLSGCKSLQQLLFEYGKINTLDLREVPSLKALQVYGDNITNILFANKSRMERMHITCSNLRDLDLSKLPNIKVLAVPNCSIEKLNLSYTPLLETLVCHYNNLSELDIRGLDYLTQLTCGNQHDQYWTTHDINLIMNHDQKALWDSYWNSDYSFNYSVLWGNGQNYSINKYYVNVIVR